MIILVLGFILIMWCKLIYGGRLSKIFNINIKIIKIMKESVRNKKFIMYYYI